MKFSEKLQCYQCEKIATTKDHIPPKCFFPKQEDLTRNHPDGRGDLITVPACLEHNILRSRDDEYAGAVIAMNSKSDLAFTLFKSKRVQALLKREGVLGTNIFSFTRNEEFSIRKTRLLISSETLTIPYEMKRIERVIESIARALYYLESGYQEKWMHACTIKSPHFLHRDLNYAQDVRTLAQVNHYFLRGEKDPKLGFIKKGLHPEVFYYQCFKSEDQNLIMRMVFYGSCVFFASCDNNYLWECRRQNAGGRIKKAE